MADFTLAPGPFPVGTTVGVYSRQTLIGDGGPIGALLTSAVVGAASTATFSGLAYATDYWAAAPISGTWRKVAFATGTDPGLEAATVADVTARVRRSNMPLNLIDEGGAVGDGITNDTAAVVAAAASALASGRALYLPPGHNVLTDAFSTRVGILADDPDTARFTRRDTAGGDFILVQASFLRLGGFTANGRRAVQPVSGGGVVGVARPNGSTGYSGGIVLTAGPTAGATSIVVSSASPGGIPIEPGEMLSFVEGALMEYVRVADTYVAGATTIALYEPLKNAYTVAASVSACATDVNAEGMRIFGGQRDGLYFWNSAYCKAIGNSIGDCVDTSLSLPCGGIGTIFANNTIETNGRWGIGLDSGDAVHFPLASGGAITGNHVRLAAGGTAGDGLGEAIDAILIARAFDVPVTGNHVDITKAGIRGIRLAEDGSHCAVNGNTIRGRKATGVYGIMHTTQGAYSQDNHNTISANTIRDIGNGIDLDQSVSAIVSANTIYNCQDYAINAQKNTAVAQQVVCLGNDIDGCVVGIRGGGTGGPGATLKTGLNNIRNASFAPTAVDAGWTLTSIAGFA
jgi:hypothetical protein